MTTNNVVAWPGSPDHREAEAAELARLRAMEADLPRPVTELTADLHHLRAVASEARTAMAKVADHETKGYARIALGAFTALRTALEEKP
jgi:hypothetical protein